MRHCGLICLLFFCHILYGYAAIDNYRFRKLDVTNGLSNNEVQCVYKGSTGFMWIGTPSGLNRYDGYEVTTLKQIFTDEVKGSLNNDIRSIQESYDHKLWLQTAYSYAIYDLKTERFETNVNEIYEKYCGVSDFSLLYIDRKKNFWFILWDDIRMYDVEKEEMKIFQQGGNGLSRGLIIDVREGKDCYWFLFDNGLIECMDAKTHQVIDRNHDFRKALNRLNVITMRLFIDSSGDVWVYNAAFDFGIGCYDVNKKTWQIYSQSNPERFISNNVVTSMGEDSSGNIWAGTDHGGVTIINKSTHKSLVIENNEDDPLSLAGNTIKTIYRDDLGLMWLGTYKNGVCYYSENLFKFSPITTQSGLPYADINCFEEDAKGNLWIGTNGGGLIYYDRQKEQFTSYRHIPGNPNSPAGDVIVSMETDMDGKLWIGYYMSGMDCFDGKQFKHYRSGGVDSILPDNNVWHILCTSQEQLWVATLWGGVIVLDPRTGERLKYFVTEGSVSRILERKSGEILIGMQRGLFVYNAAADRLVLFEKDVLGAAYLNRYDINALYEDSRELLWIGTRNGLFVYDYYDKDLHLFEKKDGLSSELIQSIIEDEDKNMWFATNRGLTFMKVRETNDEPPVFEYSLENYDSSNGLQGEQFNFGATFKTAKSELVFGGATGFNIVDPSKIVADNKNPQVVFTDLQIYNKSILPGQEYNGRIILEESIRETQELTLKYSDKYFTLSFAALDYLQPGKVRYLYKLEGFNDEWLEADHVSRRVTYTNLSPGNYTFLLKALSEDGGDEEFPVSLKIKVLPPYWQTAWAWMIYICLIVGAFLLYRNYMLKKNERKLIYAREKLRITQQHEMDEMKLSFFTNISHEFRTPLSLIISPLEELLKKVEEGDLKKSLSMIYRNALQLLTLVNQLLDFRKLDVKGHKLNNSMGDIMLFAREQASLFNEIMKKKQITYTVTVRPDHLLMSFDADKMGKVINNILYNAHKFTPAGGRVSMEVQIRENILQLAVTDTGIGIPEDDLEKVFERFYQVKAHEVNNQGSGLGLHLAKEFVLLHGGDIWAEQTAEGGSRFVVELPIVREDIPTTLSDADMETDENAELPDIIEEVEKEERDTRISELPKLLIVDDNEDFCLFLTDLFKQEYTILQAGDGEKGLEIAFEEIPDMIITDVMMPKMDGMEMSRRLKADIRTSHIPLILLTSKSGEESKLEGLSSGADDYITKPFNVDILMVKVRNLMEARKQLRKQFGEQVKIEPSKIAINSLDEKLINKAIEYTEQNMSNPDLSVEELSRELGMSRVHLYKKLTSITGKTPIEFIRIIRLKRAAQLLEESQMSVSEIAYEVGFNNPKYFRKYFKEEFGVLPSQFGPRSE